MRRSLLAAVLFATFLAPSVAPGHLGPGNLRAVHLIVVTYEDPGDWPYNDTSDPPAAVFDANETVEGVPRGEGGGPQQETAAAYQAAYARAQTASAPVGLEVRGARFPDYLRMTALWEASEARSLHVRFLLIESVPEAPGRHVVRSLVDVGETGSVSTNLPWPDGADPARFGAVVLAARNATESANAAFWSGDDTLQKDKAVVLELLVPRDCAACSVAQEAADELSLRLGPQAAATSDRPYLGPVPWPAIALAAIVGIAVAVSWRPRGGAP